MALCDYLPAWTPGCGVASGPTPASSPSRPDPRRPEPVRPEARPPSSPATPGEGVMCRWFGLNCSTGPGIGEKIGTPIGDALAAALKPLLGPLTLLVVLAVVLLVAGKGVLR